MDQEQEIQQIMKAMAPIEDQFPQQTSELMMAAGYGDMYSVKKLVRDQAGKQNSEGMTALMYAALGGKFDIVKLLVAYEDIRVRNNKGMSAIDMAFRMRELEICQFFEQYCMKKGYQGMEPIIRPKGGQQHPVVKAAQENIEFYDNLEAQYDHKKQNLPGQAEHQAYEPWFGASHQLNPEPRDPAERTRQGYKTNIGDSSQAVKSNTNERKPLTGPSKAAQLVVQGKAKFCGDCGAKFVDNAKFCAECGAQRL